MIRLAEPKDEKIVLELNDEFLQYTIDAGFDPDLKEKKDLFKQTVNQLILRVNQKISMRPLYILELDEDVKGYITGSQDITLPFNWILENIFITKDYRKNGSKYIKGQAGTALVNKFIEHCKESNPHRIVVEPYTKDEGAIAFYSKFGFVKSSEKTDNPLHVKYELILSSITADNDKIGL